MRISDWSSDVCSSDLTLFDLLGHVEQRVDLADVGVAGAQPLHHAPHPAGAFAARGALAAAFMLVEIADAADRLDDVGRLVHHSRGEIGRASCRERVCKYV